MENSTEFKFFSHEEIVEALTLICSAKSTKIWIQLHHFSEYTSNAKSIQCIPYPGEGSNSITLKRARNVTMKEILQMAKEILVCAETEGRLSKCHCVEDLVIEEVTINLTAGHVLISLGS